MPRANTWLPFVFDLHRSVCNSVRSHYERRDIEQLFKVQRSAAQKIMELIPREKVGSSILVGKEELSGFLEQVKKADDPVKLLEEIAANPPPIVKKKLRALVRYDREPATLNALPRSITLRRGRLEVSFRTPEQLADAMLAIAQVIETSDFDCSYCFAPLTQPAPASDAADVKALFDTLQPPKEPDPDIQN